METEEEIVIIRHYEEISQCGATSHKMDITKISSNQEIIDYLIKMLDFVPVSIDGYVSNLKLDYKLRKLLLGQPLQPYEITDLISQSEKDNGVEAIFIIPFNKLIEKYPDAKKLLDHKKEKLKTKKELEILQQKEKLKRTAEARKKRIIKQAKEFGLNLDENNK